jgi:4-alpha-glucanotransferase
MERTSGILLPIFSLPSPCGIGTIGAAARDFADFLHSAGQRWWQILPVGPAGGGNSPYSAVSARAGDPMLLDLETLCMDGLLTREELDGADWGAPGAVDYARVRAAKLPLLRLAFQRGWQRDAERVAAFRQEQREWLEDYVLFLAAKEHFGDLVWQEWLDEGLRRHDGAAVARWQRELQDGIAFHIYLQYLFFTQWTALKQYVNGLGIRIIGDLPIYVSLDSPDVWATPQFFQLDAAGYPTAVSGVPPDAFTEEGQLWGNPLYDWDAMARDGYGWWIRRVGGAEQMFDAVRIDHFRGLESYWSVPADAVSAKAGRWVKGPGMALVGVLTSWFSGMRFIAEDLGLLTPEVGALLRDSGLPGMRVLEFAFSGGAENAYLPHNYAPHCVCYTGTHDNAPVLGWWDTASPMEQEAARRYLGVSARGEISAALLRAGLGSVAETFIAQMQDWLELGNEARTNTPGAAEGNWRWRLLPGQLTPTLAQQIRTATATYGRCAAKPVDDAAKA